MTTTTTSTMATSAPTSAQAALVDFTYDHPRVRAAVADAHRLHQLIMSGWSHDMYEFEQTARHNRNLLFAVDRTRTDRLRVLTRAATAPTFDSALLASPVSVWEDEPAASVGDQYLYELRFAPIRRRSRPDSRRTRDVTLTSESDQQAWLTDRADRWGIRFDHITCDMPHTLESATKSRPRGERDRPNDRFRLYTVRARGLLTVTDPDRYGSAYATGLGRGRSYGAGMLLTRANRGAK